MWVIISKHLRFCCVQTKMQPGSFNTKTRPGSNPKVFIFTAQKFIISIDARRKHSKSKIKTSINMDVASEIDINQRVEVASKNLSVQAQTPRLHQPPCTSAPIFLWWAPHSDFMIFKTDFLLHGSLALLFHPFQEYVRMPTGSWLIFQKLWMDLLLKWAL